jgi:hypothetical protein
MSAGNQPLKSDTLAETHYSTCMTPGKARVMREETERRGAENAMILIQRSQYGRMIDYNRSNMKQSSSVRAHHQQQQ